MMKKGFTLLEVIIAIFIIAVGIVGAFGSLSQTLSSANIVSSRLVAAFLAQEGIEIVRNIRDGNWLEKPTVPWDDGLAAGDWKADYSSSSLSPYSAENLKIDGYFYKYSPSGAETSFKRKITITKVGNYALDISVLIDWQVKGKPYSLSAREILYNWK